jgi:hypothetical protein
MTLHLDPAVLAGVAVGVAGVALWLGVYWLALFATRPADVQPIAPTQEFGGDEPPAVVSLLANRWEITEDAAESTLIDLAARKYLEFRQPANDPMQTTVHVRGGDESRLTPYELKILSRVKGLAVKGVVPLTALTFRDKDQASSFGKTLTKTIVADARLRGLSRKRFSSSVVTALAVAGAIPAVAITTSVAIFMQRKGEVDAVFLFFTLLFTWVFAGGWAARDHGERDTERGRQVASNWLGLRAYLRGDESFAELPPAAVAVWDRYLSYGDAVGATRVCAAVIDLGMGNRKRVWSSFGGTWHRVKVRYPSFWPRYGQKPARLFVKGIVALALSALVYRGVDLVPSNLTPQNAAGYVALAVQILIVWPLLYGGYTFLGAIVNVAFTATVTGEVLWIETWKSSSGGEDRPPVPWLHYLAVDDGSDDRTVAWGCPSDVARTLHPGDVVTFTARRFTRLVGRLEIREHGQARALAKAAEVGVTTGDLAIATAAHTPDVSAAGLFTLDDVSRTVGTPVAARGLSQAAFGPMSYEQYYAVDSGRRLVTASLASGPAADLAIRMRRGGMPLPGIGEEAYAGEGWAAARRNGRVLMLQLHGTARKVDPRNVYWLLAQSAGRLR